MILLAGKADSYDEALERCKDALRSGRAAQLFLQNIAAQGGMPEEFLGMLGSYRSAHTTELCAPRAGKLQRIDAGLAGRAGVILGVGRSRTEDEVCPAAGLELLKKGGAELQEGEPVMRVYGKDDKSLLEALPLLKQAIIF
jgi:pyrimidine-nucleoside phosphorylase